MYPILKCLKMNPHFNEEDCLFSEYVILNCNINNSNYQYFQQNPQGFYRSFEIFINVESIHGINSYEDGDIVIERKSVLEPEVICPFIISSTEFYYVNHFYIQSQSCKFEDYIENGVNDDVENNYNVKDSVLRDANSCEKSAGDYGIGLPPYFSKFEEHNTDLFYSNANNHYERVLHQLKKYEHVLPSPMLHDCRVSSTGVNKLSAANKKRMK